MPPKKTIPVKSTKASGAVSSSKATQKKPLATSKKVQVSKSVQKTPAKNATVSKEPPKSVKKWTKEDDAASKIQREIRHFLAKKSLQKKKQEKLEYEELMDKLEKEAFAKLVKMEQEKYEKQRKKEEEERNRKKEENIRKKKMLEASFDGDNAVIENLLKEVSAMDDKLNIGHDTVGKALRNKHQMNLIDCEDAHGNTPLSEAASGGAKDTVRLLLLKGADPNSRGQFERTPLYRAAFAGHCEVVEELLERGADPRIYANDGQTPLHIASKDPIISLLENWDINRTEKLLNRLEEEKNKRLEEDRKRKEIETNKLEDIVSNKDKEYKVLQKQVCKLSCELEKRIYEHDKAVANGFDKLSITISAIKDAEAELEMAKVQLENSREKLAEAKLALREKQKEVIGDENEEELPGLKVNIRELDDVLLRDVGNRIKESGKWPLIIDISGQASTFLRYRDTNYLNALNLSEMEPEKIRLCILGALRYGKPAVLDMMEVDMFDTVSDRFDEIEKGLMNSIMDWSIFEEEKYTKLIRKKDSDEYQKNRFIDIRTKNFKFFIITKNPYPPQELLDKTYVIRIHIPTD
ncbi:DgyrCDS13477 [Dimorphilus gyrociliatus]|uniref:DgyrCDS13477 n=1 Tax=Dimorphilus gyrociliatus TaxID=2664684 RepID=A0A7I8WAR7_9ANNE|nr:DgyrCDS13477 [Dimorphilus gyrociliatus]